MTKVLLAHPGTQYSHQLAKQLYKKGLLYEFWTGFALSEYSLINKSIVKILPDVWKRKIRNRIIDDIDAARIKTLPLVEYRALRALNKLPSEQVFFERNKRFQNNIPLESLKCASAIIGFDTSSWILAQRASLLNKPFLLDQSIAHPVVKENILKSICKRYPEWQQEAKPRYPSLLESEIKEYTLATKIIVASNYTKQTLLLQGIDENKVIVNPYGVDLKKFYPLQIKEQGRSFRFLFVGSISARKGIPLLLEAWKALNLKNCELWLAGPIPELTKQLIGNLPGLHILGKLPHEELPTLFRLCDALVFPSYCEGFALVLLEALASGLPIITTEATAGPDLIKDKKEGFIIPSGSFDALCESMKLISSDLININVMSKNARLCAERFSWEHYGDRWEGILNEFS